MWGRKKTQPEPISKSELQKRVEKLSTHDLVNWAETLQFQVGRSLSAWNRKSESPRLLEAQEAARALAEVLDELGRRD